jgi:hypothetical protein
MAILSKAKPTAETPFSAFIRTANSREKKRVYGEVLRKATERQNSVSSGKKHSK